MRWSFSKFIAALCVVIVIVGTTVLGCATKGFKNWDPATWFKAAPVPAPATSDKTPAEEQTASEVDIEQLQTDLATARAQVSELTAQKTAIEQQRSSLTTSNTALEQRIVQINNQLTAANEEIAKYEEMIEIYTPYATLADTGVEVYLPMMYYENSDTNERGYILNYLNFSYPLKKYDIRSFDRFNFIYCHSGYSSYYKELSIENPYKSGVFQVAHNYRFEYFQPGQYSDFTVTLTFYTKTCSVPSGEEEFLCISLSQAYSELIPYRYDNLNRGSNCSLFCIGVMDPLTFEDADESVEV